MMLFPASRKPIPSRTTPRETTSEATTQAGSTLLYCVTRPTQCKVDSSAANCARRTGLMALAALMADL
jgi:hypothetical protein